MGSFNLNIVQSHCWCVIVVQYNKNTVFGCHILITSFLSIRMLSALRRFGESSICKTRGQKQNHALPGQLSEAAAPKWSPTFSLLNTCVFSLARSLSLALILWRLADHLNEHVSLHLVCVSQVTSYELLRNRLLVSQTTEPPPCCGASQCRGTQTNIWNPPRDWPYTDTGWCHLNHRSCVSIMLQQ